MDKRMRSAGQREPIELLLVISGDAKFYDGVQQELQRRGNHLCVATVSSFDGARQVIEARSPAVILLEESVLGNGFAASNDSKPTLWAAATSLAGSAPLIVIGSAEHQAELTALLAAGNADYVTRSESCLPMAIGLVERRLRQRLLRAGQVTGVRKAHENGATRQPETRDFGEILRHELNNPLTGILGNAELLLVEWRRRNIELPRQAELRLETIAVLAVRMRETVRRLSEEWETQSEGVVREFARRQN
jgi:signal transduction histidine kinase